MEMKNVHYFCSILFLKCTDFVILIMNVDACTKTEPGTRNGLKCETNVIGV